MLQCVQHIHVRIAFPKALRLRAPTEFNGLGFGRIGHFTMKVCVVMTDIVTKQTLQKLLDRGTPVSPTEIPEDRQASGQMLSSLFLMQCKGKAQGRRSQVFVKCDELRNSWHLRTSAHHWFKVWGGGHFCARGSQFCEMRSLRGFVPST